MWQYAFYAGLIAVVGALAVQLVQLASGVVVYRTAAVTPAGTITLGISGVPPVWANRMASFLSRTAVVFLTPIAGLPHGGHRKTAALQCQYPRGSWLVVLVTLGGYLVGLAYFGVRAVRRRLYAWLRRVGSSPVSLGRLPPSPLPRRRRF